MMVTGLLLSLLRRSPLSLLLLIFILAGHLPIKTQQARVIDVFSVQEVEKNQDYENWPTYDSVIESVHELDQQLVKEMNKNYLMPQKFSPSPGQNLCDTINSSPFFGTFVYCCNNQLFKKPELAVGYHFRCCQGQGLFTDTEAMECCGKTLYDQNSEICVKDVVVPMSNYLDQIMYPSHQGQLFRHAPITAVRNEHQNDFPWPWPDGRRLLPPFFMKNQNINYNSQDINTNDIDHPAETDRRNSHGVKAWDAAIWLNCSGRLVFNPEGKQASLLDCCGQTPYKRDRFYCVGGRLVELSYNNGQWLPPVVAPQSLRPPFDLDFSLPPSQRSALMSCSGVWYSISFTNIFLNGGLPGSKFNQRYSCCGQQVYDVYDSICTDQNTVRKRLKSELPYGAEISSYTLIMCGDFNALGWRPDLGYMPSITYLVDDSLPPDRRPDSCCGVQLYNRARYGCSVNGIYPLTRIPRSHDLVPPTCKNGLIIAPSRGLSPYWQCCGQTRPYNTLDSMCCGSTLVSIKAAALCCNGVLHSSAPTQGEKFACCGRNRLDLRFYHCFNGEVRLGPSRKSQ